MLIIDYIHIINKESTHTPVIQFICKSLKREPVSLFKAAQTLGFVVMANKLGDPPIGLHSG